MAIAPEFLTFLLLLPVLATAASLLLFANATASIAHAHAQMVALGIALLCLLISLGISQHGGQVNFSISQLVPASIAILCAQVIASPLLDRARRGGLMFAAIAGGFSVMELVQTGMLAPPDALARGGMLAVALLAASILALIGSAMLPAHPSRAHFLQRRQALAEMWMFAGYALMALTIGLLRWLIDPASGVGAMVLSALTASVAALFIAQHLREPHRLRMVGEAMVAGTLCAAVAADVFAVGIGAGVAGAGAALLGPRMARGMQIDDPAHLLGMVLLPSLMALLLPGVMEIEQLAPHLRWIGSALVVALGVSVPLWPATMLLFGLRAGSARVREGFSDDA